MTGAEGIVRYVLTGFAQEEAYRVFKYERIGDDYSRTHFRVRADLALARNFGIPVQELPLLCKALL